MARPRVVTRDTLARLDAAYRARWGVVGFGRDGRKPPCPAPGTPQRREWQRLHSMLGRLDRKEAGLCARCKLPASGGTTFCDGHRASVAGRAGGHGASYRQREKLLAAQGGLCPVCSRPVGLWGDLDHRHGDGAHRGILHPACNRLVGAVERAGEAATLAALRYLGGLTTSERPR